MNLMRACALALGGTGFTFLVTTLGAAMVFLFRSREGRRSQDLFLGFASGVMMAASVWSLLLPSIDRAEELGLPSWLPAGGGFLLGGLFFLVLDLTLPHLNPRNDRHPEKNPGLRGTTKLLTAITLHNIPEGMAIGLAFALAAQDPSLLASASALALGIGIQNFPEGAAISLPLSRQGFSQARAFLYGSLSGIVEPIGGVLCVLLAGTVEPLMPWLLAFAAGAMIYVTVDELIPDCHTEDAANGGTMGTMAGFMLMMILDVALG